MNKLKGIYFVFFFILAFIGGYLESYSLMTFNLYTFMETGNIVKAIYSLLNEDYFVALESFLSISIFIIGFIFLTIIRNKFNKSNKDYLLLSLILLLILMILMLFTPISLEEESYFNLINISFLTMYGVILVNAFIDFNKIVFVPTMITNNIRQTATLLTEAYINKDNTKLNKGLTYLFVVTSFLIGVIINQVFFRLFPSFSYLNLNSSLTYEYSLYLLIPLILNAILLIIYLIKKDLFKINLN